jgi:hypothetical protein
MPDPLAVLEPVLAKMTELLARIEKIESAPLPLWMQQGSPIVGPGQHASMPPWPSSPSNTAPLTKAAVGLPGGSNAEAVLNALLADPTMAETVRMKIEQMRSFP